MKEYFDKELVMTKKKMKILKTLINIGFFYNAYVDSDVVKVRDHCHITGKYRSSAHRDCNIKDKLNH